MNIACRHRYADKARKINFYNLFRAGRSKIENNGSFSIVRESEFKHIVTLARAKRYLERFSAQQSVGVSCPLISKLFI